MRSLFLCLIMSLILALVRAQEGAGIVGGGLLPTYSCPSTCRLPLCQCASTQTPGGLNPQNIPQLMTLTFDDNVDSVIWSIIRNITDGYTNPNGCPLAATFFVSTKWTDFWEIQQLYAQGHEIAVHTMSKRFEEIYVLDHVGSPPMAEIVGAYQALAAFGGIPKTKVSGFRTPFLAYTQDTYKSLSTSKVFLYDSSMSVDYKTAPIWPYTLDHGPATQCQTGACPPGFSFPGLWSVPMYTLDNPDGSLNAAMDPNGLPGSRAVASKDEYLNVLKHNFLSRYNSTRVPMGVYLHAAASVSAVDRTKAYQEFIKWTLTFRDVYWVTNQQLLDWVKNPTNAFDSLTAPSLDCLMPATANGNTEICDGVDNDGNGQIDEGLTSNCYYPGVEISFTSCFGCPPSAPGLQNPVPVANNSRPRFAPDYGCPNGGSWDPSKGVCMDLVRATKGPMQKPLANDSSPGSTQRSGADPLKNFGASLSVISSFVTLLAAVCVF